MTEPWGIALFTGIGGAFLGMLGWIAIQLRQLRKELTYYIKKQECHYMMDAQCGLISAAQTRLDDLTGKVWGNQQDITQLKARMDLYHKK